MTPTSLWRYATSSRTTVNILVLLCALLVLNVILPQEVAVGREAVERFAGDSRLLRFLLFNMRLARLSTSPVFALTISAFFLNLAVVLVDRMHATVVRLRFVPPTEAQVRTLAETPNHVWAHRPSAWAPEQAERVLSQLGYRVSRTGPASVWGIRNRTAVLGFPLFHLSFFVLCAGGLALYWTRYVTTVVAVEGQAFSSATGQVVRRPPRGTPALREFVTERVQVRIVQGRPVQLGAELRRLDGGDGAVREAWVNHPAEWGSLSVLVERAGIAPILWLQDQAGYTRDRVAVPAITSKKGTQELVRLGDGSIEVQVTPVPLGQGFPSREELSTFPVSLKIWRNAVLAFDGVLRPGEQVRVGTDAVRVDEVRYWVILRLVDELGGGLLVAGFLLAVIGLVWRLFWFRREVGILWDDGKLVVVCRVEYFPRQFRAELAAILDFLVKPPAESMPRTKRGTPP